MIGTNLLRTLSYNIETKVNQELKNSITHEFRNDAVEVVSSEIGRIDRVIKSINN